MVSVATATGRQGNTMPQQPTLTSIYDAIDYIYANCHSDKQKGDMFERVSAYYLRSDPQLSQVMGKVWLWDDNPLIDDPDTGIDLVAEDPENEGRYWAIQCKCYDQNKTLPYEACSTFWSTAALRPDLFSRYMLVATTEHLSKNVKKKVAESNTIVVTPSVMADTNVEWSGALTDLRAKSRTVYELREHQENAVNGINRTLDEEGYDRCKAIMACGTGKTLMSLRLAEGRAGNGLVLFAAPSIALVSQSMREWTNQAKKDLRTLVVCSDAKASSLKDEDTVLDVVADLADRKSVV